MTSEQADRLEARGSRYMFQVNKRVTIDGSPRWNVARYINHSCKPNAEPVGRNGGIVIVALRRIEPGEEITYDYGKEYLEYFLEEGGCRCDSCRRKRAAKRRKQRRAARKRN
jgi:SET domain-containing protein